MLLNEELIHIKDCEVYESIERVRGEGEGERIYTAQHQSESENEMVYGRHARGSREDDMRY